jgi:hypothetical protein
MIIEYSIGSNTFKIEPYRTYQEKDILLSSSFGITDLDEILKIVNFKFPDIEITDDEKKVLLYKHREISLGDEIDIKFKCDECGQVNDGVLLANNFVSSGIRDDEHIKKINKNFSEKNMQEYVDVDIDELDIEEYENLKQMIIDNQIKIDLSKSCKCLKCGSEKSFNIGESEYIIEIMSDDNLMSLYKSYNHLTFFGNYTKQDIDSMFPFERNIFIGLLNKTKEDLSK